MIEPLIESAEKPVAHIKRNPADFVVREDLGFAPAGSGEHVFYLVRKEGCNTVDVARALADALEVSTGDIGYAGRKDRHAITEQWFSAVTDQDVWPCSLPGVECLRSARHTRKLRRGQHRGNQFVLRLRETNADAELQLRALSAGFPNYFGAQRLSPSNVEQALEWLAQQHLGPDRTSRRRRKPARDGRRGWQLSVLRSMLFNSVVAARVARGNADQSIAGDVLVDDVATGPLWGRGRSDASGLALEIEQEALQDYADVCASLEYSGLNQDRRAIWVVPENLQIQTVESGVVELSFALPAGAYATSMLEHVVNVVDDSATLAGRAA